MCHLATCWCVARCGLLHSLLCFVHELSTDSRPVIIPYKEINRPRITLYGIITGWLLPAFRARCIYAWTYHYFAGVLSCELPYLATCICGVLTYLSYVLKDIANLLICYELCNFHQGTVPGEDLSIVCTECYFSSWP